MPSVPNGSATKHQIEPKSSRPPSQKQLREPPYMPRCVYGFYLSLELAYKIGMSYTPQGWLVEYMQANPTTTHTVIEQSGYRKASEWFQRKFPDLPLRWHQSVVADVVDKTGVWVGFVPILVLGHQDADGREIVDVHWDIDLQRIQTELKLGDQEPRWHTVDSIRGGHLW